jgi:hypothetical protein
MNVVKEMFSAKMSLERKVYEKECREKKKLRLQNE